MCALQQNLWEKFREDLSESFENAWPFFDGVINKFFFCVAEKYLSILVRGWQGKIQWNVIIHKEGILQQYNNGEHHRHWLQTCQKNQERLWITKFRSILCPVCTSWYPVACRRMQVSKTGF